MTFYIKYRPQNIDELDIDSVRDSLTKIMSSKHIPHAFLFAGSKGTGKTSAARIIAKIVNCESEKNRPCGKCDQCKSISTGNNIDIIELDAASNRGIDDIRSLRDNIKLMPAKAKKKVYIIDEAHMLTTEASNALLKTLEEPPEHVIFILATTNPEKLIDTVRSRATTIVFTKATAEETVRSLTRVVKGEKLSIEKDTLLEIAKAAKGSFRDATKILEQLVSEGQKLTKDVVENFLFKTKTFVAEEFISLLVSKDTKKALLNIEEFVSKGVGVETMLEALLERLRAALLTKVGIGEEDIKDLSKEETISLIELLSGAQQKTSTALIEQLPFELAVISWGQDATQNTNHDSDETEEDPKISIKTEPNPKVVEKIKKVDSAPAEEAKEENQETEKLNLKDVAEDVWKNILSQIRPINTSIEALLRAARPMGCDGKTLILGVYYRFHKERLEENSHRKVLEDVIASVMGIPMRVVCKLTDPPIKKVVEQAPEIVKTNPILTESKDQDIIKAAEEIFSF